MDNAAIAAFLESNSTLSHSPLVPEIALYLAEDVLNLWRHSETLAGETMPPPYWGFAWPGGQALARDILDHPKEVAQKSVLDFGSGCGLLALAAAKAGARHIDAAEIDSLAQTAIARNAACNNLAVTVRDENLIGKDEGWQTVLVGDMCYERPLAEALTVWLRVLAKRGARVLLGDPGRSYLPQGSMEELARYEVPTVLDLEDRMMRETAVYVLHAAHP